MVTDLHKIYYKGYLTMENDGKQEDSESRFPGAGNGFLLK